MGCGVMKPGFEPQLCHLISWVTLGQLLSLSELPHCKMGTSEVSIFQGGGQDKLG